MQIFHLSKEYLGKMVILPKGYTYEKMKKGEVV